MSKRSRTTILKETERQSTASGYTKTKFSDIPSAQRLTPLTIIMMPSGVRELSAVQSCAAASSARGYPLFHRALVPSSAPSAPLPIPVQSSPVQFNPALSPKPTANSQQPTADVAFCCTLNTTTHDSLKP